ncbi:MAG: sulfatase [Deltaproteobacteria bacterium]|nr:sulfatase [Deltaproteobacteria bacterium]
MVKNVIVIMFDTLQFNYIGCYGNDWIKTPNMDRLAREGILFENNYIEGLPTVPCRRSMFTGRYHVHSKGWSPLDMEDTTIADLCWGRPIDSALIFDCPMFRLPKFGYTRGFDKVWFTHGHELDNYFYEDDPLYHVRPEDYFGKESIAKARKALGDKIVDYSLDEIKGYLAQMQYWKGPEDHYVARTVGKAIEYLEKVDRNKQFFLWIDSFDPHEPWNPPSVYMNQPCPYDPDYKGVAEILPFLGEVDKLYTEPELHHIRMLYAEMVSLCDTYLGVLMDAVRLMGLEENTLFMLVSDHGSPMGNGEHGHGIMRKCRPWPYEELTHAPMILRAPGLPSGTRIKTFTQSCDIAPTVCDWLGIGVHPDMTGKSLLPLVRGEVDKLHDFAVSGYYQGGVAFITEDWYLIHWMCEGKGDKAWIIDAMKNMADSSSDIVKAGGKGSNLDMHDLKDKKSAADRTKEAYTLNSEEQWTCTPGSSFVMPEEDELYNRKEDPFQLNNVVKKYPEIATELLQQLRLFLSELKVS